ncbi:CHAT domain-containing protein [Cyanothece sp. BG0011]|uniref:CHAT domain-containing protein n=1 Tax=Cyanothece sp. BG0011 TaxID=2082950 RepID=UPI000D1E8159|nr:CHAT domain-containing protein [Cyanothece sp. BG0011]
MTNNLFQTIEPTSYQQNTTVTISESNLSQDEQLALHYYWQGQYQEALAIWESLLQSSSPTKVAEIHRYLGVAYQDLGQMGRAISHFQEALSIYEAHPSTIEQRQLAEVLIAIGQTQNELGQGKRAIATLRQVISLAEKHHFPVLQTIAYRHLGTAFLIISDFDQAIKSYSRSRELAAVHELPTELVTTLNNLTLALLKRQTLYESQAKAAEVQGNQKEQNRLLFLAQQNHIIATETAKQALDLSQNKPNLATVRAMINLMQLEPQQNFLSQIKNILLSSRPSRSVAQLLQNVAQLESQTEAIKLLERAIDIATNLGDFRTQSYALGHLGHIYEQLGDYSLALEKTQQAQWAAQQVMAADSLYRWQWQAARIFEQTNQDGPAKKAYEGAITTLQKLREEIANASPALQLNVQEDVEPVYRQFLSLLLEKQPNIAELQESLEVINQLQLVELQSFFGDPCLEIRQAQLAQDASLPSHTARIHTLILSKSTQMILELPDGTISSYSVALSANDIEKLIEQWRLQLESSRIPLAYRNLSERFYNLLIKPMSKSLSSASIKHLIFVNDGLLRNVPMVALHDGQKFLIEKYTISNSLGINVQFSQPITNYRGSIFGLSVSVADFPPLPYVPQEIQQIINVVGGEKFIDESFTVLNLKQQISKNFPIIHLATHGYFGGTAKTTFLQSFERPIFLREFEQILSQRTNPIQLLTLSACQTATGNKRAVLGLAGVALRSGVKSVLATLWSVRDKDVVSLLSRFYRYWQQGLSLEEAYQKTLVEVIQQPGTHPKNWSSFVLITN